MARDHASLDDEIQSELAFHIEQRIDRLVAEGINRQEAESRVRRQFGSVAAARKECRRQLQSVRRREYLGEPGRLVRHAIVSLRRAPAYTLTIILLATPSI